MLFDLRARGRRRAIKVIYLFLALLMGGGLIFFGIGGSTSERGAESAIPHARGIPDERGNLMVLITFNTDFGDAFEREGDNREYFEYFAGKGYAFGIDVLLYAMTH